MRDRKKTIRGSSLGDDHRFDPYDRNTSGSAGESADGMNQEIRDNIRILLRKADCILQVLSGINTMEHKIMASLDEAVAAIAEETTMEDSYIAFLVALAGSVKSAGLTPEDQAKVDKIFADAKARAAAISAAMTANTPADGGSTGGVSTGGV